SSRRITTACASALTTKHSRQRGSGATCRSHSMSLACRSTASSSRCSTRKGSATSSMQTGSSSRRRRKPKRTRTWATTPGDRISAGNELRREERPDDSRRAGIGPAPATLPTLRFTTPHSERRILHRTRVPQHHTRLRLVAKTNPPPPLYPLSSTSPFRIPNSELRIPRRFPSLTLPARIFLSRFRLVLFELQQKGLAEITKHRHDSRRRSTSSVRKLDNEALMSAKCPLLALLTLFILFQVGFGGAPVAPVTAPPEKRPIVESSVRLPVPDANGKLIREIQASGYRLELDLSRQVIRIDAPTEHSWR